MASRGFKRKVLSLRDRVKVLEMNQGGRSCRSIAAEMGVGKTQIQLIVKDEESIMKEWNSGGNMERKYTKTRKMPYEFLNTLLWQWFCEARARNVPVTGKIMQEKALLMAMEQGLYEFSASNGWLDAFNKRHNIRLAAMSGKNRDACESLASMDDLMKRLPSIIEKYAPEDIYNADETTLYYRAVPSQTMMVKEANDPKEKITMLLCCSATGEKLDPFIIGKSSHPTCFIGKAIPGSYAANKRVLMTSKLFMFWLSRLNNKMIIQDRKILLLLDKCSAHPDVDLSNVKLLFLPPCNDPKLQPCKAGIIRAVKTVYRKRLLQHISFFMEDGTNPSEIAEKVNLLDAIYWLHMAWDSLPEDTIVKYFKKSGLSLESMTEDSGPEAEETVPDDMEVLMDGVSWEDYVTMDDSMPSIDTLGDNWEDEIFKRAMEGERVETPEPDDEEEIITDHPPMLISSDVDNRYLADVKDFALEGEHEETHQPGDEEVTDESLPVVISRSVANRYLAEVKEFALVHENKKLVDLLSKCQHVMETSNFIEVNESKPTIVIDIAKSDPEY